MTREPEPITDRDEPFRRVPLVPFRSVPIIHRELMMEVVVALPKGHKRRDEVVSWRVLIIECAFTQPMSQRIDREGRLRNFTLADPTSDNAGRVSLRDEPQQS